jgi:HD-like signal output (HDOD) protein/ActR/RegA family two-component response regulator
VGSAEPDPTDEANPPPASTSRDQATVLFVDDEPAIPAGLHRLLHKGRPAWRVLMATSGDAALQVMATEPVDVLVTDMRMPGMTGAELLAAVHTRYPRTARIVLSGYADRETLIASVGPAQQFLPKPIRMGDLIATIDRVLALTSLIDDDLVRQALGGVGRLPKPPLIYQRITVVTADPDYTLDDIVEVINSDLTTAADLLRLANASFFALVSHVDSIARAVTLLGLPTVQALVVAGGIFRSGPALAPGLDPETLTHTAMTVAATARTIAQAEGWPLEAIAHSFTAGLLHQIALPVLAAAQPDRWTALRGALPADTDAETQNDLFRRHFGCTPGQASAYLLGLWGFPEPVIHAVAEQPAHPTASPAAHLLTYARHTTTRPGVPFRPHADGYLDQTRLSRWTDLLASAAL